MKTLTRKTSFLVPAPREQVFPLLCPVMEYRWLKHWKCEMVHSESGVAELDCIFRTDADGGGTMTWVVSRYEPPALIEFTCLVPERYVMRLRVALSPEATSSRLEWTRRMLALSPEGELWIDSLNPQEYRSKMTWIERSLVHYLKCGEMLQA